MARDNPDTGWWCGWPVMTAPNPGAMTGGRVWAEPAPVAPVPQAGADIILPPEVLAQRAAEEQQRREMENRRNRLPGKWPGRRVKPASRRTG